MTILEKREYLEEILDRSIYPLVAGAFATTDRSFEQDYPYRSYLLQLLLDNPSPGEISQIRRWLDVMDSLDKFIQAHEDELVDADEVDVRSIRQHTIYTDIRSALEAGKNKIVIHAATGVGKTVIFSKIIKATGMRTLIVVPTLRLVDQTIESLAEFSPQTRVSKVNSITKKFSGETIVTTYPSLIINTNNGKLNPRDFELLILDEEHEAKTLKRKAAIAQYKYSIQMGFTATPENLDPSFGEIIHTLKTKEAIREGMLCEMEVYTARVSELGDLSSVDTNQGEYDKKKLLLAMQAAGVEKSAVDLYEKMFYRSGSDFDQAIVCCIDISQAERVAKRFNDRGIPARTIHHKLSTDERSKVEQDLRQRKISVLCQVKTLRLGWSYDDLIVNLNIAPTQSTEHAMQRVRVTRKSKNIPNKRGVVVDWVYPDREGRQVLYAELLGGTLVTRQAEVLLEKGESTKSPNQAAKTSFLPDFLIDDIEVTVDANKVAEFVNKYTDLRNKDEMLTGWITATRLADKIGRSYPLVSKVIAEYRASNPEWFLFVDRANKKQLQLISLDLADEVELRLTERTKAPEGWKNITETAEIIGRSYEYVKKRFETYSEKYQEGYGIFEDVMGREVPYISPTLIELLREESPRSIVAKAPEGWLTIHEIRVITGRSYGTVADYVDTLRSQFSSEFGVFKDKKDHERTYLSPSLSEKVIAYFSSRVNAPEGWKTKTELCIETDKPESTVNLLLDILEKDLIGNSNNFESKNGSITTYFSPDVVAKVKELATWATIADLRSKFGFTRERAIKIIEYYESIYPQLVVKITYPSGSIKRLISHELVEIIESTV